MEKKMQKDIYKIIVCGIIRIRRNKMKTRKENSYVIRI